MIFSIASGLHPLSTAGIKVRLIVDVIWPIYIKLLFSSLKLWKQEWEYHYLYKGINSNGYPLPAYPAGKNPIRVRVWKEKIPMGM